MTVSNGGIANAFHGYDGLDSYLAAVARGEISGAKALGAYGERTTSGAESNRVIWPNGVFSLPSAAGVQMSVVSTSADDAAAGTNIRTVRVHYLDADLAENTETVELDGTTPVLTTATDIRFIQCVHVATFGTTSVAAGDITLSNGGTTYSQISTGAVRCSSSARMVPAGKNLFVAGAVGGSVAITAGARSLLRIVTTEIEDNEFTDPLVFIPSASVGVQNNGIPFNFLVPIVVSEGNVIAITHTSSSNVIVSGSWFGWLENS